MIMNTNLSSFLFSYWQLIALFIYTILGPVIESSLSFHRVFQTGRLIILMFVFGVLIALEVLQFRCSRRTQLPYCSFPSIFFVLTSQMLVPTLPIVFSLYLPFGVSLLWKFIKGLSNKHLLGTFCGKNTLLIPSLCLELACLVGFLFQ